MYVFQYLLRDGMLPQALNLESMQSTSVSSAVPELDTLFMDQMKIIRQAKKNWGQYFLCVEIFKT